MEQMDNYIRLTPCKLSLIKQIINQQLLFKVDIFEPKKSLANIYDLSV